MEKIVFVRAALRGNDYNKDAIEGSGYKYIIPYKDYNLFLRLCREAWFRLHLPFRNIWFNKQLKKIDSEIYVFCDSLMCPQIFTWMHKKHPNSSLFFAYENRVRLSTCHVNSLDRNIVTPYSYDDDDCKEFNMKRAPLVFVDYFRINDVDKKPTELDVVYVGRDKGRADYILSLEKQFNEMGLKTYFHLCADRSMFSKKKDFYKPVMPYVEYLEYVKKSKAIMNIVTSGTKSVSQRDLECVFDNVKCITNNPEIKNFKLYDPSRYFVIGVDDLNKLPEFLNSEFKRVSEAELEEFKYKRIADFFISER